jgi:predicted nucleic acid-binding protein
MIVIADTTPLNYLVLIHQADLLPKLFGRVLIPPAVFEELRQPETPQLVQAWIANPPAWLQVQSLRSRPDPELDYLDWGEREAITLAQEIHADPLLLDETDARREAARRQLPFIGTLGVFARRRPARVRESPSRARSVAGDHLLREPRTDSVSFGGRHGTK